VVGVGSTRVQLWRLRDLDRDGAWAYGWRTTQLRGAGRRTWTEGVLVAHPERGVTWLGPDVEGLTSAVAVLTEQRRRTGRLPGDIDLWVDPPPDVDLSDLRMPGNRRSRSDRYEQPRETLGERAARERRQRDRGD
jgi:hypothetical protein